MANKTIETGGTMAKLVAAAQAEFNECGFDGTDTNRIARRAGFAPQTFYRWFKDKTEIFVLVYERWQRTEAEMLVDLLRAKASDLDLARAVSRHHREHLIFRRSLRRLAAEEPAVRAARAESRLRQLKFLAGLKATPVSAGVLAATLLQLERLADAIAEGELEDMAISPKAAELALAGLIATLRE